MPSYVAIDLGGTNVETARFDADGDKSSALRLAAVHDDAASLIARLAGAIAELAGGDSVAAIGIGVPGNVERATGRVVASPNYRLLTTFDIRAGLQAACGVPVAIDNDANVAALGEHRFGAPAGRDGTLVHVTLGTGIGGGIVHDGRLLRGKSGFAGELGHVVVEPNGAVCGCGGQGCVEQVAAAPAIVRRARAALARHPSSFLRADEGLTAQRVGEGAAAGDPLCREVLREAGRGLGIAVAGYLNVFNPDWLVIGGGVAAAGEALLGPMRDEARRRAYPRPFADCALSVSTLGADAALRGAYALALDLGPEAAT